VELELQSEQGYPHKGHLDQASTTKRILVPGLFVRMPVPIEQCDKALLVADAAIGTSQQGSYLLVAGKVGIVEQRPVKPGRSNKTGGASLRWESARRIWLWAAARSALYRAKRSRPRMPRLRAPEA
jgi:hypothetical protein